MKKFILILVLCFLCSGCSFLKLVTAPFQVTKNSVPQSTEESKSVIKCKGNLQIQSDGTIICEKGFYQYTNNYEQQDRRLNFRERVAQFIAKGAGYLVWGAILAGVLTFFGFGWIISGIFNMLFGAGKVLRQTIQGIQNARKNNVDLGVALSQSQDEDVKKWIVNFKMKNGIK